MTNDQLPAKKAIYTAIFGNYDKFTKCLYDNEDYDYHLFTDNPAIKSNLYKIHLLNGDARKAREIKILPHKFLPDYDYSVWMDGNIIQARNINELVKKQTTGLMTMKHPLRSCIYSEAAECIAMNKDSAKIINTQISRYRNKNFSENMGLIATGLLFRKHTPAIQRLCSNWWHELKTGSLRDQLSFNYVLNQPINLLPFSVLKTHFIYKGHRYAPFYKK